MIREILNLSVLNAFKVDPADVSYPLAERLPGKRLALVNWGPNTIKVSFATKQGGKMEVAPEELYFEPTTPISKVTEALGQRTDCNCVAVLYSAMNLFCEAQSGGKIEPGVTLEKKLRNDPKGLVGSGYEDDKTYQMILAPDRQTRILFAVSRAPYRELEQSLQAEGLIIVRSQIAPYALLNALLADKDLVSNPGEELVPLLAVVSQAHVIVMDYNGSRFSPEIFRATPLFMDKMSDSPEAIEQIRAFFANCAESAVMSKRIFGKRVIFHWAAAGNAQEATLDLGSYLQDRSDVEFKKWPKMEVNVDFKALVEQ
jgi:hypothetical protein